MPLTIGILKETAESESRVAATPDAVKKLIAEGVQVVVENDAGLGAFYPNAAYVAAGATIASDSAVVHAQSDLLFSIQMPDTNKLDSIRPGTTLVGFANPYQRRDLLNIARDRNLTLMGMDFVPRITRAQSIDALSSQSNIAGYRAVIEAANFYPRAFPMMMTAAGTVAAARVFIMGAGVAGLQAIATARRLGAIVSATDVRMAAKEQVESLGAKFIMVDSDAANTAETSGGYAREMSEDFKHKQAELIAETIKKQDIIITTALIPGKPAPRLVSTEMILSMRPGSVIVDMAVDQGGNVEGSQPGHVVLKDGVTLVGYRNLPSRIASDSSALYARNLLNFFHLIYNKETGAIVLNMDDDIIKAMTLTHNSTILQPQFA